ncbi:MAG: hypothetical protein AAF518_25180 [Spirochaetota bacterium]
MKDKDILLRFFELSGNDTDSLVYLKKYQSVEAKEFALIYISPDILTEFAEAIFYVLKLLSNLELYPVLVMQKESLQYLELFYQILYDKIRLHQDDDFRLEFLENEKTNRVAQVLSDKKIPVLVAQGKREELVSFLQQHIHNLYTGKFIYFKQESGLFDKHTNQKLSIINLMNDSQTLKQQSILSQPDQAILELCEQVLQVSNNRSLTVSITSPLVLFKELFSVKGNGTLIKRGSKIAFSEKIGILDRAKLLSLMQTSFKKKVKANFFDREFLSILYEINYRGAAVMRQFRIGYYLTKFAVDEIARGEGIGRELWDQMIARYHSVFWRARPKNSINKWYTKECSGMQKYQDWFIYWINIDAKLIPQVCEKACSMPVDFEEENI